MGRRLMVLVVLGMMAAMVLAMAGVASAQVDPGTGGEEPPPPGQGGQEPNPTPPLPGDVGPNPIPPPGDGGTDPSPEPPPPGGTNPGGGGGVNQPPPGSGGTGGNQPPPPPPPGNGGGSGGPSPGVGGPANWIFFGPGWSNAPRKRQGDPLPSEGVPLGDAPSSRLPAVWTTPPAGALFIQAVGGTTLSPEEIRQNILEELDRIRETVTEFLESIEPRFGEHLQDDPRKVRPEVRQRLHEWSEAGEFRSALDRLVEKINRREESSEEPSPIQDDVAFQTVTSAAVFDTRLGSIDAQIDWELTSRGFNRQLHAGLQNWARACKSLFANLRPRIQSAMSWLAQLISRFMNPKEWAIQHVSQ